MIVEFNSFIFKYSISKANFKNAIAEKFDPSKILKVMPKKDRKTKLKNNYFVYVRNEDDLEVRYILIVYFFKINFK